MTNIYFGRITDVLPSRVMMLIPSDKGIHPILRGFDKEPMVDIIDLRAGNVVKITIETIPGQVTIKYEPANRRDYDE